jgi:cell division transport system permease protein
VNFRSVIKASHLSWREHKGVQLATIAVLASTFTVVISFFSFTSNLRNVLHAWGDSVQMTAYLKDGLVERDISSVAEAIKSTAVFKDVTFISKDEAKSKFNQQMSNFAPGLPGDPGIENPFPASFQMSFVEQKDVTALTQLSDQLMKISGVEDVSYGQDWIQNYATLVDAFRFSSWIITIILILGSLFVVANSIRASLDRRRDEIDILKLVGASDSMIRVPFIFEGALLGALSTGVALVVSYLFYLWQVQIAGQTLAFTGISTQLRFLELPVLSIILATGTLLGSLGSLTCVYRIRPVSVRDG